jgi:hypothetical protein
MMARTLLTRIVGLPAWFALVEEHHNAQAGPQSLLVKVELA